MRNMTTEVRFRRRIDDRFVAEKLPDGSLAIFDAQAEAVHSLNESATLVLEACEEPATVADVVAVLESCTGQAVSVETALDILDRLEAAELVVRERAAMSRRSLLRTVTVGSAAALALPTLLTLTASEQRLHAQVVGSPPTTTSTTPTTPAPTTTLAPTTTTFPPTTTSTTSTTTSPPTTTSTTSTTTLPPTTTSTTSTTSTTTPSPA
jgi:DNA-binding MarR family transcriptional regulator